MRSSILLATALGASTFAAPVFPQFNMNAATPDGSSTMSEYFNMLARKVEASKSMAMAPVCDLSAVQMPVSASTPLPEPSKGLRLKHVAIGRGTQNYTCDLGNSTAVPVAAGAVATLFNASCVAASYPDLLGLLPAMSLQFNLSAGGGSEGSTRLGASDIAVSGHHFFTNATTPFFNLDTAAGRLGEAPCAKNSSSPAPPGAARGQRGEPAVPWLKLLAAGAAAPGDLQEVYRLGTAGGSAPASCRGMPAAFEVQYAAEYWFYERTPESAAASDS